MAQRAPGVEVEANPVHGRSALRVCVADARQRNGCQGLPVETASAQVVQDDIIAPAHIAHFCKHPRPPDKEPPSAFPGLEGHVIMHNADLCLVTSCSHATIIWLSYFLCEYLDTSPGASSFVLPAKDRQWVW